MTHIFRQSFYFLILLFISIISLNVVAGEQSYSGTASSYDWMDKDMSDFTSDDCIEKPKDFEMAYDRANMTLDVSKTNTGKGGWVVTNIELRPGKKIVFRRTKSQISSVVSSRYLVLYRIDPRFPKPQIFIQKYDIDLKKYVSDFHNYRKDAGGNPILMRYQENREMEFKNRIKDYVDYFNFNGREKINVRANQVVNIRLIDSRRFFKEGEFGDELTDGANNSILSVLHTESSKKDNVIIYSDIENWCDGKQGRYSECSGGRYRDSNNHWNAMTGMSRYDTNLDAKYTSMMPCPKGASGEKNTPVCKYNDGRGMKISIGGKVIKRNDDPFLIQNPNSSFPKYLFYHIASNDGVLDFDTDWKIKDMIHFPFFSLNWMYQFMKDWNKLNDYEDLITKLANYSNDPYLNFVHFGRYIMLIEIGDAYDSGSDSADMPIEYAVANIYKGDFIWSAGSIYDLRHIGEFTGNYYTGEAKITSNERKESGYYKNRLLVRAANEDEDITGIIKLTATHYFEDTPISKWLYDSVIEPVESRILDFSSLLYSRIVTNSELRTIAHICLILYIVSYAIMFLMGAESMQVSKIVPKIFKIVIVVALFDKEFSRVFFDGYLYSLFLKGISFLLNSVSYSNVTGDNIFVFIDPIVKRFTNGEMWALLGIQLLQITSGLFIFSIITIQSIIIYIRVLVQVIVSYMISFIVIAILVTMTPFFVLLLLFERTSSMFQNWISSLFSYLLQPTILLIFILFIDQVIADQFINTITRACWGELFKLGIGLDLTHMGIPIHFNISLDFLPAISFYIPDVAGKVATRSDLFGITSTFMTIASSSLLFFALCKMAEGAVSYVEQIVGIMTQIAPAKMQTPKGAQSATTVLSSKIVDPVYSRVKGAGSFLKDKTIGQKIDRKNVHKDFKQERTSGSEDTELSETRYNKDKDDLNVSDKNDKGKNKNDEKTKKKDDDNIMVNLRNKKDGKKDANKENSDNKKDSNKDRKLNQDEDSDSISYSTEQDSKNESKEENKVKKDISKRRNTIAGTSTNNVKDDLMSESDDKNDKFNKSKSDDTLKRFDEEFSKSLSSYDDFIASFSDDDIKISDNKNNDKKDKDEDDKKKK